MINAGKYNKRISIYKVEIVKSSNGFQTKQKNACITTTCKRENY